MKNLAFINAKIYTPSLVEDKVLLTEGDKIKALVSKAEYQEKFSGQYQEVDCHGLCLSPGFIDLQLNGCGGANFNETLENLSEATLEQMHACNIKHGTTSFCPTLITSPVEFRIKACELVNDLHARRPETQSYIPGLHIEGPHISFEKKGTHNPDFIKPINDQDLDLYLKYKDAICMLTLAPEANDLEKVKVLLDAGILISMGHTNATYEQAKEYINAGVKCATHLYNGMTTSINGRTPGVVGAIYDSETISPGIITDGVHINWALVNLSLKVKKDKIFIVTDAVTPAGTDMTEFEFASKIIKVINEGCYDDAGCLSGSAITMDSSLRRLQANSDLNKEEIIALVTRNPAAMINRQDSLGAIKEGYVANLALFDEDFNIKATYVNGEEVYRA